MKSFKYDYPWTNREAWWLPDGEEMMQGQFPILDEQIDFVLEAVRGMKLRKEGASGGGFRAENLNLRTCVQAGGAFGVYPRRLADYFDHVWTFEPLLANLQCMAANLGSLPRADITVVPKALWFDHQKLQMVYSKPVKNSYGAHHVSARGHGMGEMVEAVPLDEFDFEAVDLIWLDIEGSEVHALMGARETIQKCKPVIVIEEHKHLPQHKELNVKLDSASRWLKLHAYKEFGRTHGDLVFVPQ
jgi:FkbM family methyltransferase